MLRQLRRSSPARVVLCLAVLLATAAAFGLHPEPPDDTHAAAAFSRADSVRSGPHLCVACLTHAAATRAALTVSLDAPSVAPERAPLFSREAPPRLGRTPCSGLSPPSLS